MRNAERVFLIALGALLGTMFGLPLLPWELPEENAALIGAAIGAIFAVAGSAWLWYLARESAVRDLASYIVESVTGVALVLRSLAQAIGQPSRQYGVDVDEPDALSALQWVLIDSQAKALEEAVPRAISRLSRIANAAHQLGPGKLFSFLRLEDELDQLKQNLQLLRWHLDSGVIHNGGAPRLSHRQAFQQAAQDFEAEIAVLRGHKTPL